MSTDAARAPHAAGRRSRPRTSVAVASQLQLTWWRFRRHRLAVWSGVIVRAVLSGRGLRRLSRHHRPARHRRHAQLHPAPGDPLVRRQAASARTSTGSRACATRAPSSWSTRRTPTRSATWRCSRAAMATTSSACSRPTGTCSASPTASPQDGLFLLGTDLLGRDVWSRLMLASRTSLTIGLVGVALSPVPRRAAGRHLRPLWRLDRRRHPARDRDPALDPDHPAVDGPGRRPAIDLERDPGLFRHHRHHLADRLDRARPRRARPVPGHARGGLHHRGRARRAPAGCGSSSATWSRRS